MAGYKPFQIIPKIITRKTSRNPVRQIFLAVSETVVFPSLRTVEPLFVGKTETNK